MIMIAIIVVAGRHTHSTSFGVCYCNTTCRSSAFECLPNKPSARWKHTYIACMHVSATCGSTIGYPVVLWSWCTRMVLLLYRCIDLATSAYCVGDVYLQYVP